MWPLPEVHVARLASAGMTLDGAGLDLAIVRQVVDEHSGAVTIERADGGGTLVRLRLPEAGAARTG